MNKNKQVIKHSSAIQITNNVNLLQRRAWNVLLANAYNELMDQEEHSIELRQLTDMLDYSGQNLQHLKESLKTLTGTSVEWNILGKDSAEWGSSALLASVVIKSGTLTYSFSPPLRKKLHNPQMYAKISLSMQNKFGSKHALALYEMCVDYFDFKKGYGETPYIPLDDFRELMGLGPNEYTEFKRLSIRVIRDPITELNEVSDLYVDVKFKRVGRKIEAVKFCIHKKTKAAEQPQLKRPIVSKETIEPDYSDLYDSLSSDQQESIHTEAYNQVPFFVKEYEGKDYESKVFTPVYLQKRNEILKRLFPDKIK